MDLPVAKGTLVTPVFEGKSYDEPLFQPVFMPVVAGVSYEMIRLAGRSSNPIVQTVIKPGLWLQLLTTRKPHPDQIEVAIRALEEARPVEVPEVTVEIISDTDKDTAEPLAGSQCSN